MDTMKFRKALLRISNQLSRQDLEYIKFLCEDDVPRSKMERVRSGTDLFNALEERGRLSSKNLGFLVQVLTAINRTQLVDVCLRDEGIVVPPSTLQVTGPRGQISQQALQFMFRECLVKIAMGLQSTEINDLVFVFQPKLQVSPDTVFSATNLFTLLMQRQILTTSDLRILHDSLCQLQRFDLVRLINEFLAKTGQQPYSADGQGMIIDHPGRTGNQNQTPVEETGPARVHSDPGHGNLGAHLTTQYYHAQAPGAIGGGYPPHHHQMTGLSSAGTSLPSDIYRSVSTPSSTTMDYPPAAGGGMYVQDQPQLQYTQFRPEMMDTSAPPTGMSVVKRPPPTLGCQVVSEDPLQHMNPIHHSGDVKPFGLHFDVFEFNKPDEPVSSPPSMQELQQQRLLQDLAMKQGELVRKEEEIERLRMALEEANSDKSKVYSERLGEAEQFKQNIRELENILATKNEEVMGLAYELQRFHQQMELVHSSQAFDEKEFYRMDKNPHGICVIINNHKFYHPTDPEKAHSNRGGAEVDQKNLKLTFEYLRYKVELYENLTHTQMRELMLSLAQRNHAEYDSFICCILTHGEQHSVHGADSIAISLLDLTGVMKMCTTLINKPKMFFIQACRGEREDEGHKLDDQERDSGGKQPPSTHTIPQEADFFFGYATPLGNAAYRSRRHGSWYISELCKVLTTHAYQSNLSNMMRKVNDNICRAFTKEGFKQTSEFVDRLRKGVHFFHFSKVQQQQQR